MTVYMIYMTHSLLYSIYDKYVIYTDWLDCSDWTSVMQCGHCVHSNSPPDGRSFGLCGFEQDGDGGGRLVQEGLRAVVLLQGGSCGQTLVISIVYIPLYSTLLFTDRALLYYCAVSVNQASEAALTERET